MIPYSLYDAQGYVQQEGYCATEAEVLATAAAMGGLRIYWGLTETKFIDAHGNEAPMPPQP